MANKLLTPDSMNEKDLIKNQSAALAQWIEDCVFARLVEQTEPPCPLLNMEEVYKILSDEMVVH